MYMYVYKVPHKYVRTYIRYVCKVHVPLCIVNLPIIAAFHVEHQSIRSETPESGYNSNLSM